MKRDYIEFQDRSIAKAYLITFRCYGTWFHGDERGSADRRYHNEYGTPKINPNADNVNTKAGLMKGEVFVLGPRERSIVEAAIKEVCSVREYGLFALNVRTNHAHVVVSNAGKPERMMDSFKAHVRATDTATARSLTQYDGRIFRNPVGEKAGDQRRNDGRVR